MGFRPPHCSHHQCVAQSSKRVFDAVFSPPESRMPKANRNVLKDKASIGPSGGVIQLEDVTFEVEPGCLIKDTEIDLATEASQGFAPNSLLDIGLINSIQRVVKFEPEGLKLYKPAVLMIRREKNGPELFVLHGSQNPHYQKILWEVVSNGIDTDKVEGHLSVKINDLACYTFILAMRGMLPRILCHYNYSFICRAYVVYRRDASRRTIDIAVILVSEFVDDNSKKDIKQLKDHFDSGYRTGEKGELKRVHTDRRLQISLQFPGIESRRSYEINQAELDSGGYAISDFVEIALESPADGSVKISEVGENALLWELTVRESGQNTEEETDVVYRTTKLTSAEISRMSLRLGLDWDNVAGLLDIPYHDREEIRFNFIKFSSKAEQVLLHFNESKSFDRHVLETCLYELDRDDLINIMRCQKSKSSSSLTGNLDRDQTSIMGSLELETRLSSRELYRLSRRIVVDWEILAGLLDISAEDRNIICTDRNYNDVRSRAEKMLLIFNRRAGFSREKLANCFKEIGQLDLIEPILKGQWRSL